MEFILFIKYYNHYRICNLVLLNCPIRNSSCFRANNFLHVINERGTSNLYVFFTVHITVIIHVKCLEKIFKLVRTQSVSSFTPEHNVVLHDLSSRLGSRLKCWKENHQVSKRFIKQQSVVEPFTLGNCEARLTTRTSRNYR